MNIIRSGSTYRIYNDSGFSAYEKLPNGTYDISFHPMMGFSLIQRPELETNETKIYGSTLKKIKKIFKSFEMSDRNFGVILSGDKGSGKTLFARELCRQATIPVIIASTYYSGIGDFISSIDQEVIVLFDEFEKSFSNTDDAYPQDELLPLFDGLDNGKKLFLITCNDFTTLNDCLLDRPGRFHYHFALGCLTGSEINEYLADNLLPEYQEEGKRIANMAFLFGITYDALRAICFELNQGYSLNETMEDLNLSERKMIDSVDITVRTTRGTVYTRRDYCLRLYDAKQIITLTNTKADGAYCQIWFDTKDILFTENGISIKDDEFSYRFTSDYEDDSEYSIDANDDSVEMEKIDFQITKDVNRFTF